MPRHTGCCSAPAAAAIRQKALVIVPGRALGRLPFELLVEPAEGTNAGAAAGGRFLVQGHRLRYAPSLTVLHLVQRWEATRPRPERPLWAVGDPIYEPTDPRLPAGVASAAMGREGTDRTDRNPGRRGTTGRAVEAAGLQRRGGRATPAALGAAAEEVLIGPAATETAVKAASAAGTLVRHRYVHFATHGLLRMADAIQPALVLSLTGDQSGEDGFLRLDEVTSLRLNADLVVLSACQTGQGQLYNAEGVNGLARAFLYAGSRGVLCSLWRVEDESTAALMADIYAGLKAKKSAADALREAQLRMIAAGQPPLYWAPFIFIGQ